MKGINGPAYLLVIGSQELIGKGAFPFCPDQIGGDAATFRGQSFCREHFCRQQADPAEVDHNPPEGAVGKAQHRRKNKRRIDHQITNLYCLRLCLHVHLSLIIITHYAGWRNSGRCHILFL